MALLIKFIALPLYPLGLAFVFGIAGIIALRFKKKLSLIFWIISLSVLIFFSSPVAANLLARGLENKYPPGTNNLPLNCSAIVVLGGSGRPMTPPRIYPEIGEAGDRLIHAARLFKAGYSERLITTGGPIGAFRKSTTEGEHNAALLKELGINPQCIIAEKKAKNTHEHAPYIEQILDSLQLPKKIILVTSATHMARSVRVFEKKGYQVYASAADYTSNSYFISSVLDFFPNANALMESTKAIHEYYGIIGYKLLGWI
ncbi:MAG: YdcF family protein [Fibrobacter sp.]|nr:YdcF family protein [Fibrobacter sp.]